MQPESCLHLHAGVGGLCKRAVGWCATWHGVHGCAFLPPLGHGCRLCPGCPPAPTHLQHLLQAVCCSQHTVQRDEASKTVTINLTTTVR